MGTLFGLASEGMCEREVAGCDFCFSLTEKCSNSTRE